MIRQRESLLGGNILEVYDEALGALQDLPGRQRDDEDATTKFGDPHSRSVLCS
jgi:hypothetical protein